MNKSKYVFNRYCYYWCDHCDNETKHIEEQTDRLSPIDRDPILLVTCTECWNSFEDL